MEVGGLAFRMKANSFAMDSRESLSMLIAIRRKEPRVFMASGKLEGFPLTVGFSKRRAFPPPAFFIWRSAAAEISNSVAMGSEIRINSPVFSRVLKKSPSEAKAIKLLAARLEKQERRTNLPATARSGRSQC